MLYKACDVGRLILVTAFFGLVGTLAVAVLCIFLTQQGPGVFGAHNLDGRFVREGGHTYFTERSRGTGMDSYLSYRTAPVADDRVSGGRQDYRPAYARNAFHDHANSVVTYDAGWPLRVVRGAEVVPSNAADAAYRVGLWRVAGGVVPFWPIWMNLAASVAFYGAIVLIPMWASRRVRGFRRRKRGWCAACGYDLAGQGVRCPECGQQIVS